MMEIIRKLIINNWDKWDLGSRPNGIDWLLLNHAKMNFAIFKKGEKFPCLLIKMSKDDRLKTEYNCLKYINRVLPRRTPKPYDLLSLNGYFVLPEEFIVGSKLIYHSNFKDLIHVAFMELIEFHKAVTTYSSISSEDIFSHSVSPALDALMRFTRSNLIHSQIKLLRKKWESIKNINFIDIPQHCDFSFANLLYNKENITIIDWEDFSKTRLPLHDAITLINSLYLNQESFEKHLIENNTNEIFRSNLLKYCNLFQIERKFIHLLFATSLTILFSHCHSLKTMETIHNLLEFYLMQKDDFVILSMH